MHPRMQVPVAVLTISAALQCLFVLASGVWFGLNIVSSLMQLGLNTDSPELMGFTAIFTIWGGLTKLPQLVLLPSGLLTARAAWAAAQGGRVGAIRIGAIAAMVGPFIALVGSFCLWLSFDCIGFVFGGIGRALMLILGIVGFATTHAALLEEDVLATYEADDEPFFD